MSSGGTICGWCQNRLSFTGGLYRFEGLEVHKYGEEALTTTHTVVISTLLSGFVDFGSS